MQRLADGSLVVLVGPPASGKSAWAGAHFAATEVVGSDALRAVVGTGEHDLAASADAFAVLDLVVAARVARRLTTVVDTLGLDPAAGRLARARGAARRRRAWPSRSTPRPPSAGAATRAGRQGAGPPKILTGQLAAYAEQRPGAPPPRASTRC